MLTDREGIAGISKDEVGSGVNGDIAGNSLASKLVKQCVSGRIQQFLNVFP